MAEVRPGELRKFADYVKDLLKELEPLQKALADSQNEPEWSNYPEFGDMTNAATVKGGYDKGLGEMVTSYKTLYDMLQGIVDGSNKIADNYDSAEALNSANVDKVKNLLDGEIAPTTPGTPPPTV